MTAPAPGMEVPRDRFPRKVFKGVAGAKLAISLAIILISVVGIIVGFSRSSACKRENERYFDETLYARRMDKDMRTKWDAEKEHMNREFNAEKERMHKELEEKERMDRERRENMQEAEAMSFRPRECDQLVISYAVYALGNIGVAILFIVTGSLGVGAARTLTVHRQSGLKTGYLVMSILCALFFAPLMIMSGVSQMISPYIFRMPYDVVGPLVTGIFVAVLGFVLCILSIVGASFSCCCAPPTEEVKAIAVHAPVPMLSHVGLFSNLAPLSDDKAKLVENDSLA